MNILDSKLYNADLSRVVENLELSKLNGCSILVTGGLGLICSSVVDILIKYNRSKNAGITVYVADINDAFFPIRFGGFEEVKFIKYDATKPLELNVKADYIIHGAGLASPELYTKAPVETVLSNFNGVYQLLEYSKQNAVKRLLYISSSEVYGKKETEDVFTEGQYGFVDIDSIRSSYPVTKRASEMLCKSYTSEYGVDTVSVRPGHIFGPTASPKDKRISSEFAYMAAMGKNLEMKSSGIQKRSYVYCLDCAAALLVCLLNGESGQAYNISTDDITTIAQMAEIYAKAGNVALNSVKPTQAELTAFNPMNNSALDHKKLYGIGFKKSFDVAEGLEHTVKILKEIL